ncbi:MULTISPECIES: hypothetical protein [unclassified Enterobacter]|uniref:hypothetical protein n=1 Tax=unclassified Enterobacter TaxID=2608935 RepID=UPI0038627088|nr:hypothetical protein [Enterobacter chengduensis]
MTANKPMTGEQLDELMTIAVNMQRDSEKSGDRPTAMFAYAVQVAVMELRKVRDDAAALAAENAGLKSVDVWMNADEVGGSAADKAIENGATPEEATRAGVQAVIDSFKTPTTNTFLAEVRAQARNELVDELEARFTELSQTSTTPELRIGAAGAAGFVSTFRTRTEGVTR